MEVILLERVGRLGGMGDVVKVKPGYGRNFLIPQKKALRATEENKAVFEARRATLEADNAKLKAAAEKQAAKLEGLTVTLIRQASEDGKLYGSVVSRDIAEELAAQGHNVERKHVQLPATIKNTGSYPLKLALHPEVSANITVNVSRNEAEVEQTVDAAQLMEHAPVEETPAETSEAAE